MPRESRMDLCWCGHERVCHTRLGCHIQRKRRLKGKLKWYRCKCRVFKLKEYATGQDEVE